MITETDGSRSGTVSLHGRASALAQVAGALDAAEQGQGRVLLVFGSPGLGKSSVLDEAVSRARGRGFRIGEGWAVPRDTPAPFDLVRELLHSLRGNGNGTSATATAAGLPDWLVAESRASLLSGFPRVGILPENDSSIEKRILSLFELERLLDGLSRQLLYAQLELALLNETSSSPLLLAIDDLHHADRESLEFLRELANRIGGRRVLLLTTADPEVAVDPHRTSLITALSKGPSAETISLPPLSIEETGECVRDLRPGVPPAPEYVQALHTRSKGVPAAIQLLARRYTGLPSGVDRSSAEVLPSAESTFQPSSLPDETLRILTYGAVIGRQFDSAVLGRTIHRRSGELIESLLAPLVDSGTLRRRSRGRYEFALPSVRQELYAKLTEARRRLLHRNVARALEVGARPLGPELFEIAWHYYMSGEPTPAIDFNRRAAELASRELAYDSARLYLERALDILRKLPTPQPEPDRAVRTSLGHVLGRLGRIEEAVQVMDSVRDTADVTPLGRSSLEYLFSVEVRPDLWTHAANARQVAERSLRAYRSTGTLRWLAVAQRGLGVATWSLSDPAAAEEHHRAAAALAHQAGDARLEGQSVLDRANLVRLLDPDGLALSRRLLTEATERFTASGDAEWLARAYMDRAAVLRELGRLADALADLSAASEQAGRTGSVPLQVWVETQTARILVEEGRTGRARKALEHLRQLAGSSPHREVEQQIAFITGMLQEREGRLDRARELYEQSLHLAADAGVTEEVAESHLRLAGLDEKTGRPEEAKRHRREADQLSGASPMARRGTRVG